MVRNFQTVKGSPFLPILVCRKKTGPRSVILIARAITVNSGANSAKARAAEILSKTPLITRLPPASSAWSTCSSGSPATGRMVVRGPATSSSADATHISVPVFSRSQASSRSRVPSISGHARMATVSALNRLATDATLSRPPQIGTSATSS